MTHEAELRQTLGSIINEIFELSEDPNKMQDGLDLVSLGDSVQFLEFISLVEARFKVAVADAEIRNFGELVQILKDREGARPA
jgi:acyl carrier protein